MWSDDDDCFSYSPYCFGSDMDLTDDDDYYFDEDECCGYSSGENHNLRKSAARLHQDQDEDSDEASSTENTSATTSQILSLQDLCCRFIALKFPFAYVEHRSPPIPDELQLKIIGFSFPEDEQMIMKYAQFSRSSVEFSSAKTILDNGNVKNLSQIGFRLSATVDHNRCSDSGKGYYVTVHFDRGKITSAHCSCDQSTNWCVHVIATCLARIKDKNTMTIRMPVSDSLNLLCREQLLKFAQYLLCEHQNERTVETAQQLLDKLLSKEQKEQQEDINVIAGAPDPTAGPGLDEEAHWFVCKSGFQSSCKSLMYESYQDLGFVKYSDQDIDREDSVKEVWGRNWLHHALVRDEMDLQLDDSHYGYSSSQRLSILQVLETIADLLQDDFMSAVSALTMCTEQLIERLTVLCRANSPGERYRRPRPRNQEPKSNLKLCGSLAGCFTPRLSQTVSDELSRLWRLSVLSPRIPAKERKVVVDQLRTLNERVSVAFVTGPLRPWHGLEVAIKLSSIDWNLPDFQQVLKGEWTYIPVVSSCMAIGLTCESKNAYVSEWMALDQCDSDVTPATRTKNESNITLSFYTPHCVAFSSLCSVDIHSVCSVIEALNSAGDHQRAMRFSVAVSYALVSYYKKVLFGLCDASSMPVSARCLLGTAPYQSAARADGNNESDSPMEIDVSSDKPPTSSIWPEGTLLAISTFAFLFEMLSQKLDLVDTSIAEMRTKLRLDSSPANALDCPKTAMSLKFQLGVVGLCQQRLPASSLRHEKEEYNYECWLTYQLICCSPADADLSFLTHLGRQVSEGVATPSPAPQSSLSRVIFHHLFKSAPAALSKTLTEQQNVGLKAALSVLSHVNKFTVKDSSSTWMLFEYANCRLWAKLAEVVVRSLSDSPELLGEAMSHVLQPDGMLGARSMKNISVDSTPSNVLSRLRDIELISGKSHVAYRLGRVLSEKQGNSIRIMQFKTRNSRGPTIRGESSELDIPRKIMKSGVEKTLKLCAVQIVVHSLWLQKLNGKDRRHADSVSPRWLTDLVVSSGVESLECLVQCKGDITTIIRQGDLLDLCEKVLRKSEPEEQVKSIVQNILLLLLQKASHTEAEDDMKSIISFCSEKHWAHRLDLLPWICTGLQTLNSSDSFVPFEVLMDASHGMLEHYKERLASAEQQSQMEWGRKGHLYLRRLFNEETRGDDDSENEESCDSVLANRNSFRTAEAHPFLETAFNLGMMGLEKLGEKPDEPSHDRPHFHYRITRVSPVKEHLNEFCRLVCYLMNKKWLTDALTVKPGNRSPKRDDRISAGMTAKPGCSHWGDSHSQSASKVSSDSSFLQEFVLSLINNADNPLWLFDVLQVLGDQLGFDMPRSSPTSKQERQNLQISSACKSHPPVNLLLQKALDKFSKLLLGQKMADLVTEVSRTRDRRRLEPSEIINQLRHGRLGNTRLQEVLQVAKRAFGISDSSGTMFKNLTDEMATAHPILKQLLERVLKDDWDCSSSDRESFIFPRADILPALFAQGLFPGLIERRLIDDYLMYE